jgi:hypothetical protein
MKSIGKLAAKAALAGGLALAALTAAAPADAGVVIGVGVGHPYHRHFCWRHPGACRGVVVAGPRIGVFYGGRGWWDGHRYWGHRYHWHGGWRYR